MAIDPKGMVFCMLWPAVHCSQVGVARKQPRLVISVTLSAIASFPPARRVQTAAEAIVQGTAAATKKPLRSWPLSKGLMAQANSGNRSKLTPTPSMVGRGRLSTARIESLRSVKPMASSTLATSTLRGNCSTNGVSGSWNKAPSTSVAARASRNQRRWRNVKSGSGSGSGSGQGSGFRVQGSGKKVSGVERKGSG